jgi:DNA-binding winged helix-turn-helix (wHTH) protein/TolB-like protein/tetratricopeptide (TPR) repeat protein
VRNGRKLRIPEQAAQLLTILLERAGTLVTRDELRQLMWPNGEYLDYDHSISNAINQLRNILRDNSRAPTFIETMPKRGYRFLAPVDCVLPNSGAQSAGTTAQSPPPDPHESEGPQADVPTSFSANDGDTSVTRMNVLTALATPEIRPISQIQIASTPELAVALAKGPELRNRSTAAFFLAGAVLLLLIVGFGLGVGFFVSAKRKSPQPAYISVGIAPFEAESPEAKQLADGFRLDLTDALSQLPRIQVRAAHSFSSNKHDDTSVRALAQTLQLDTLLFGKLTLVGNHVELQLEVVRGRDAVHLASFRYSGTTEELSSIRDDVQRDVFARLESTTLSSQRMDPGGTENPEAYEDYLNARARLLRWTNEPLSKVLEGFQAAVALDPGFAKAYAGMASAYVLAAEHSVAPRDDSYRQAEQLAKKAITLDPSEAEAHTTLGFIRFRRDWDTQSAERELRQAVDLEPNQASHHTMLALLLGNTGRFEESLHQIDLARQEDPLWPPVYLTEMYLASSARLNNRSMAAADKLIRMMPDWPLAHDQRGWALWYSGRYEEAIAEWRSMALIEKDPARLALEDNGLEAFRRGGVPAYARVRLRAIHSGHAWAHPNDFELAEWYLNAGDREKSLSEIKEMVDDHDPESLQLAVSPAYTNLHQDPLFLALLSRIGLTLPHNYPKS